VNGLLNSVLPAGMLNFVHGTLHHQHLEEQSMQKQVLEYRGEQTYEQPWVMPASAGSPPHEQFAKASSMPLQSTHFLHAVGAAAHLARR
jgi:hypothetical protein